MKVKITIMDDSGKKFFGEVDLVSTTSQEIEKQEEILIVKKQYSGLKGGINFLIDEGFLSTPKSSKEVAEELRKENYFHSLQSVDKRLRFLVTTKSLTRIVENEIWKYVVRK